MELNLRRWFQQSISKFRPRSSPSMIFPPERRTRQSRTTREKGHSQATYPQKSSSIRSDSIAYNAPRPTQTRVGYHCTLRKFIWEGKNRSLAQFVERFYLEKLCSSNTLMSTYARSSVKFAKRRFRNSAENRSICVQGN
uniref:(northern house mosquito) hypothetical protein n=2 Tax=Culex pipiens TaxID=7175 RepID=A0A8D8A402_CULPI